MTGYNPLNRVKVNLESVGICQLDGMRFTDPNCTHGTPEQIAHCKAIDERMDNEDIFGHPIERVIDSSLKMVRIPFDDHSVPVGERVAMVQGTSELSPAIQRAIKEGTLDINGGLLPYKSKRRHQIADDHEIHSYTYDGDF